MVLSLQISLCLVLIALSSLFAGAETGVYRISRLRLRLGIQQKKRSYSLLGRTIHDRHGLMLSLLTGNNLANYMVTSLVTYMLLCHAQNERSAEFYATLIMAPTLFVLGDILPKTVFYYRADDLLPRVAPLLWFFHRLFTWSGIVVLLKAVTKVVNRLAGTHTDMPTAIVATARHHVKQMIQETRDEGLLSPLQRRVMDSLIGAPGITARQVMVPIAQADMVDVDTDRAGFVEQLKNCNHVRLCVFRGSRDNVTGFINLYKVLAGDDTFENLAGFVEPIARISATQSILDVINTMQSRGDKIVVVTAGQKQDKKRKAAAMGILTMEDLVEEIIGESAR